MKCKPIATRGLPTLVCLLAFCVRPGFADQGMDPSPDQPSPSPRAELVDAAAPLARDELMLAQAADRGCCVLKTAPEVRCMSSNRSYCSDKAASAAVPFTFLPGQRCQDVPECSKR